MSTREHRPSATQVRTILQNGLVLGINDSVWVYRQVPMETIADARTEDDRMAAATPLYRALNEVSKLVPGGMGRRSVAKSNYRQVHLLAVNIPALFTPKPDSKLRDKHADMYPNMVTSKRVCLMGVRLVDSIGKGGSSLRETVNTVAEVLLSGSVPLEDFALDHRRIDQILARCGLATPDPETMRLADGWWNFGSAADIPVLPAPETMHYFTSSEAAAVVEKVGINNRADWPEVLPGHHSVTFASLADLELHYESASSDFALWVSKMYESNAAVVSIRGAVEPRKITQKEVRRRRRTYLADIEERVKNNKMNRQEQDERFQELGQVEAIYADDGAPPTLIETSVIVGFDGEVTDMKEITDGSPAVLHIMQNRQYEAWAETMIASGVRANPHIHDIPSHVIASSGINSLSVVGDEDGAILGFTELDSQVAYIDPSAASEEDELPIMLCAAGTGSGKTVMALHLADQFVDNGNPVIIIDPKALPLDAEILTPDTESGTITMRDITEGTRVFDRRGKVCTVTLKSRIFTTDETRMFEIATDDGQVTRADANHMWPVLDPAGRKKAAQDPDADLGPFIRELTTQQILDEGVEVSGQSRFALPVAGAVEHDEADLPISPYLLGAWLGDGTSKGGEIVCGERDLEEMTRLIEAEWGGGITTYRPRNRAPSIRMTRREDECYYGHADFVEVNRGDRLAARCRTCEVQAQRRARRGLVGGRGARVNPSLTHLLRDAGVLNSKHIPHAYMTASASQRLALLQGIMDTDGTVKKRGDLRVSLADEDLARDVLGLVRSLGIKASIWSGSSRLGDYVGEQHVVTFRTDKPVFRLSRKAGLQPKVTPVRSRFLYITEIREVEQVEAQCIRVDSPDHTYQIAGNIVTHNTGSDHSPAVMATGKGRVYKLDDLAQADGIFDPISFSADASVGVQLSVTMLMQIAPWGAAGPEFETQLTTALAYGTSRGAGCIGEALRIAVDDKRLDPIIAQPIFELAEASTTFRACAGMSSSGERLRVSEGINLIMVGDYALDLPAPGLPPESQQQRVAMALVRMMVFGSAMALTNRKGVIFLDEAWIFLQSGASEVIKLGRLARSQRVFPILLTQRVSDALGAGLEDFISRTLIGAIENNHEAYAACKMAKLDPTPERIARITASATIGQAGKKVPNWQSMKALRNKETRETYRGAVYIYSDLAKRAVPVEVRIPESKLEISSTNPIDINRRRAKEGLPPLEFTSDSESDEA